MRFGKAAVDARGYSNDVQISVNRVSGDFAVLKSVRRLLLTAALRRRLTHRESAKDGRGADCALTFSSPAASASICFCWRAAFASNC